MYVLGAEKTVEKRQSKGGEAMSVSSGSTKKFKLRTCMDTIKRIIHDQSLPTKCFCFGYLDRFVGIIERPVASANWGDISVLDLTKRSEMAVPKHRIQYIKCNGVIVWDKRDRTDLFWKGSGILGLLAEQLDQGLWCAATMAPLDMDFNASNNVSEKVAESSSNLHSMTIKTERSNGMHHRAAGHMSSINMSSRNRPNFFVSLRVNSAEAQMLAHIVQTAICKSQTVLSEACLPLRALHITLLTLRLDPDQLQTAQNALSSVERDLKLQKALQDVCSSEIVLDRVSHFREGQVIYGRPSPSSQIAIRDLRDLIAKLLIKSGLNVCELERDFNPHMTIAKLSHKLKQRGFHCISEKWYARAVEKFFRIRKYCSLTLRGMFLCKMKPIAVNAGSDGFYKSLLKVDLVDSKGINCKAPLVVILRGSPGSGKSTVVQHLCNEFNLHATDDGTGTAVVCSNDEYFVDPVSGLYEFRKDETGFCCHGAVKPNETVTATILFSPKLSFSLAGTPILGATPFS